MYGLVHLTEKHDGDITTNASAIATNVTTIATNTAVTTKLVGLTNWTITESGGSLYFATGGVNKMQLTATGNLNLVGSVANLQTIA